MDGFLVDGIGGMIFLVFGLLVLVWGFVCEVFFVMVFVIVVLVIFWLVFVFNSLVCDIIDLDWFVLLVVGGLVFFVIYLVVMFVMSFVLYGLVKGEDVNVVDCFFGFVFGIICGLVLLVIGVFIIVVVFGENGCLLSWVIIVCIYFVVNVIVRVL